MGFGQKGATHGTDQNHHTSRTGPQLPIVRRQDREVAQQRQGRRFSEGLLRDRSNLGHARSRTGSDGCVGQGGGERRIQGKDVRLLVSTSHCGKARANWSGLFAAAENAFR